MLAGCSPKQVQKILGHRALGGKARHIHNEFLKWPPNLVPSAAGERTRMSREAYHRG